MSAFLPLFSVSVEHGFFSGAVCSGLDFVATSKTQRMILNAGLLLRKTHDGFHVAYDDSRLEALQQYALDPDEPLCFEFKVYSSYPEFKSVTEPFPTLRSDVLYFSNDNASMGDGSRVRLHRQQYVSKMDFVPMVSAPLNAVLNQKDRLIPPVLVINISANDKQYGLFDEQLMPMARHYLLRFKARETIWKYFLLGDMAKQGAYIVDPEDRVEFESAENSVLADQRVAMTFRSKQSIPLNENYGFNFQLKQKVPGREKVLIKRLPVARITQTGKEVVAEQGMVVSEIYINS